MEVLTEAWAMEEVLIWRLTAGGYGGGYGGPYGFGRAPGLRSPYGFNRGSELAGLIDTLYGPSGRGTYRRNRRTR